MPMISTVIRFNRDSKFIELKNKIANVMGVLESSLILTENSKNKILRKYMGDPDASIKSQYIKNDMELFAYEVAASKEEIEKIYPIIKTPLKYDIGEIVDIYDSQKMLWKIGKIQRTSSPTPNDIIVELDPFKRGLKCEIKTFRGSSNLAPYMTHTINFNEFSFLPIYHRYKKVDGSYSYFGLPKLISLCSWATCRQLVEEVHIQCRHFMKVIKIPGDRLQRSAGISYGYSKSLFSVFLIETNTNMCAICSPKPQYINRIDLLD